MEDVCILHLTDIHAGPGELSDEDGKVSVRPEDRLTQLARLTDYITVLPKKPDFVIVSGDITIKGCKEGMEIFRKWLIDNIKDGYLPASGNIIIVPGNHDITRQMRRGDPPETQFKNFSEIFGTTFPHAYLPHHDPQLNPNDIDLHWSPDSLIGGITAEVEDGRIKLKSSWPFLLDLESEVLIFGFNSALGCGIPIDPDKKILAGLDLALQLHSKDDDIRAQLQAARNTYLDSLVIDAGWIADTQLRYFSRLMSRLRRRLGRRFDRLTKIAVLHHHVSHLWRQQLELKTFEATVDAAQLKQALVEHAFDIVVHGHKHTNHVGIDGALIPVSTKRQFDPLCIVSGGTVGGYPRLGDHQSFKLLFLAGKKGPRTRAVIQEIPIVPTANPAAALIRDAKIYHAPTSRRLPFLHDIGHIKAAIDNYVIQQRAPELAETAGEKAHDVDLGPGNKDLFARSLRYRCHSSVDDCEMKTYYEVMLATEKLGFRAFARIHWLVSDGLGEPAPNGVERKVVILIGNLEATHYSEAQIRNEIRDSIKELEKQFRPAIVSGHLSIRSYDLSQDEIMQLTQQEELITRGVIA